MILEYLIKCKYYGKDKIYHKKFNTSREYNSFKNWITTKRGYTNIRFLKKEIQNVEEDRLVLKRKDYSFKKKTLYYILNNKKPIKFNKFIYCLNYRDEVVYVGKTSNIQNRILTHKKDKDKEFDSFSIISKYPYDISDEDLCKNEKRYIKLLKPKHNKAHNNDVSFWD